MKLGVRYETNYRYSTEVNFARHEIRLFPRADFFTRVRRVDFRTNADANVRFSRDIFDNSVAACTYERPARELSFTLELDLELREKNPFDFLLPEGAHMLPLTYPSELRPLLAPFQHAEIDDPLDVPCWKRPTVASPQPTVAALADLNRRLHECIGYERREQGAPRSPAETLRAGRGACRDVALLLAAILRQLGLAARLTSGYLQEAQDAKERHAEGSLHAWTEVYLPGAGWIGLDATNGIFANHNFIATAVGISPGQVTPIDGHFYPPQSAEPQMTSRLELINL